ncbi:hypothetical protein GCM10022223_33520 [Kineosporia mesophila]|uniref:Uncharacterized protein n=1 Tax=Kineosporia mesophila TaxID=566012 RepID=A0ABP6ZRH8_9ACTN|nr:hypothetical protein [Kineosporia mesophila]MCD5353663.1 hypothetical protein [Kineosporia mesophila]
MTFALTVLMSQLVPLAVLLLVAVIFAGTGLLFGFFLPGESILFAAGRLAAVVVFRPRRRAQGATDRPVERELVQV